MKALYDSIGKRYRSHRLPDRRIAAILFRELANASTIVNIGAGGGAYEPDDKEVIAVEPSRVMIDHRRGRKAAVVQARAEALPFRQNAFDCAMAVLTIHHWSDIERGLQEALRVAKRKVVLLTWVGFPSHFWLLDYLPQIRSIDEPMFPTMEQLASWMGSLRSIVVPIPHDCTDGFLCAYWRRPGAYLDQGVRSAISTFSRVRDIEEGLERLKADVAAGLWLERYGDLLEKKEIDLGYRVVVSGGGKA
ncbi:MAG: class I SAM-dependent methyltransferase [Deltaproteobacteria bacterium]|nr:class I SAM-dependent methyltransferase [Deltaproteobacteria bacterium]